MKRLLIVTTFLLAVKAAFSYPISPQTLRKLITFSDYIVIAQVDNPIEPQQPIQVYDKEVGDTVEVELMEFGGDGFADLQIMEVLKGKISLPEVTVEYEAGMICPAPANYPDKKIVIAFLMKEDTATTYYTYGLSYGSKIMEREAKLADYKQKILEYLDILKIRRKKQRKLMTVEWLVQCAENKNTRWEGAYELSRTGDFMSYYDQSKNEDFAKFLREEQKARIKNAFFSTDTIGYDELCLANILDTAYYPEMRLHLLNNLSFAGYYGAEAIMEKIVEITPNNELQKIMEQVGEIRYNDNEKEQKQKILIDRFIQIAKKEQ